MSSAGRILGRPFRLAIVLVSGLVLVGAALAATGYQRSGSISAVVTGYFDALQRGTASDALAYGTVPPGPRTLLTSTVLRKQQQVAPIKAVVVRDVNRQANRASVAVSYLLAFPGKPQRVNTKVGLHLADGDWRLDRVAIATKLKLTQAADRASNYGRSIPASTVLVFPGAAPISFDTPYLQLYPATAGIEFGTAPTTLLAVQVSAAGRHSAEQLVMAALRTCVDGHATVTCPVPNERCIPGSLHGTLQRKPANFAVDVGANRVGTINVSSRVAVTGSYRCLDFHNRVVDTTGAVQLRLAAIAYAVRPMSFVWQRS